MTLNNWVRKVFAPNPARPARRADARRPRLGLEGLGDRTVPAAIRSWIDGSRVLNVLCDDAPTALTVSQQNTELFVRDARGSLAAWASPNSADAVRIWGGAGADAFTVDASVWAPCHLGGGTGNDTLRSDGHGNDTLDGGGGGDRYVFDADQHLGSDLVAESPADPGRDTLDYSDTAQPIVVDLRSPGRLVRENVALRMGSLNAVEDVVGGAGGDTLIGNDLGNDLRGGDGWNDMNGWWGNDTLSAGSGDDRFAGGMGDDVFLFNADRHLGWDTVTEDPDGGYDSLDYSQTTQAIGVDMRSGNLVRDGVGLTLANPDQVERLVGGRGDDYLVGNNAANTLDGGPGADQLFGWFGNDTLNGMDGNDRLDGGAGNDFLGGGQDNDHYVFVSGGWEGSDTVAEGANGGTDALDFSHNDSIGVSVELGRTGWQRVNVCHALYLMGDLETVRGSVVDDRIWGNGLDNTLEGLGGNDFLNGMGGNDNLVGDDGNDRLFGGDGDDALQGLAGSDVLFGGDGRDALYGGGGLNVLTTDTDRPDAYADSVVCDPGTTNVVVANTTYYTRTNTGVWVSAPVDGVADTGLRYVYGYDTLADLNKTYTFGVSVSAGFIFGQSRGIGLALSREGVFMYESSERYVGLTAGADVSLEAGVYHGGINTLMSAAYAVNGSVGVFGAVSVGGSVQMDASGRVVGGTASVGAGVGVTPFDVTFTYSSQTIVYDWNGVRR